MKKLYLVLIVALSLVLVSCNKTKTITVKDVSLYYIETNSDGKLEIRQNLIIQNGTYKLYDYYLRDYARDLFVELCEIEILSYSVSGSRNYYDVKIDEKIYNEYKEFLHTYSKGLVLGVK